MAAIMVVEDDRQTNDAVSEYLSTLGYQIFSAYDGDEALHLFEQHNIDLMILDLMLPKKTGHAVLHEIRAKSSVPVLMLTAIRLRFLMNRPMTISRNHFPWFCLGAGLPLCCGEADKPFFLIHCVLGI